MYLRILPFEGAVSETDPSRPRLTDRTGTSCLHKRQLIGRRRLALPAMVRHGDQPNFSDVFSGGNLWEVAGCAKQRHRIVGGTAVRPAGARRRCLDFPAEMHRPGQPDFFAISADRTTHSFQRATTDEGIRSPANFPGGLSAVLKDPTEILVEQQDGGNSHGPAPVDPVVQER